MNVTAARADRFLPGGGANLANIFTLLELLRRNIINTEGTAYESFY